MGDGRFRPTRWIRTGAYLLTGIHHDQLKLGVPFAIEIDPSRLAQPTRQDQ
ncbi:hypothetical protein ACFV0Z_26035 [Streptomyces xiamenensis]|uniref:hypothetical protein n=1 Tax=Streptomyces xiamenensis TaxID=408015 RepID=UPI0036737B46